MSNFFFHPWARSGSWRPVEADICELPLYVAGPPQSTNRLLLGADGLAPVLSRCSPDDAGHANARELYRLLRSDLKRHGKTFANADLLLNAMREVSGRLDPVSHGALRALLWAPRDHERLETSSPREPIAPSAQEVTESVFGALAPAPMPGYLAR